MKKLLSLLLAASLFASPVMAGSIAFTPGSGGSVGAGTDGTAQIPAVVLCGATSSATLYATCLNQVFVNASGQMGVTGPVTQSGTWTVQPGNTANTTAWLVTGTGGTFPATESGTWTVQPGNTANTTAWLFNLGSIGGNAITATTSAVGTAGTGNTPTFNTYMVGCVSTVCNPNGQATAANSSPVVLPAAQVPVDPCTLSAKTNLAVSTAATALTQIIAASGSNKIYICSIALVAPGATAINLASGTGTNCGTSTAAVIGSTTAANGMSLAANGGITLGNGTGTVAVTAASSELCTLQSNAVQIAGNLTYVQAP